MDHTIGRFDIGAGHVGPGNRDTFGLADLCSGTVDGRHVGATRCQIARHDLARHDVIGQDRGQGGNVVQQTFDCARRQGREGFIGGGEHSERAFALQRVHQTSGGHCGDERRKCFVAGSDINDVVGHGIAGDGQSRCNGGSAKCFAEHEITSIRVGSVSTRWVRRDFAAGLP